MHITFWKSWTTMRMRTLFAPVIASALILVLGLPKPAYAYVDPSVVTYTIQAVAGVVVALSAVFTVAFRRARKKVNQVFDIDENADKCTEADISRIDPGSSDAKEQFAQAKKDAKELRRESAKSSEQRGLERLSWRKRLAISLLMSFFAFFTILIAPAIEVFGANTESLIFSLKYTWWISLLINSLFAVTCGFALSALRGRGFCAAMLLVFCLALAAYVQSLFMNGGMKPADGAWINWDDQFFVDRMIWSGIVWVALLVIPQLACMGHRITWLKVTCALAGALIIVQGAGAGSVLIASITAPWPEGGQPHVTQESLYTVNPKSNVVVFVLDTYDTAYFETALKEKPDMLKEFTGFTYFRNSSGSMIPTHNAMPYLLSAQKLLPGETNEQYKQRRYEQSSFIPTIHDQGYSVGLYTDTTMLDYTKKREAELAAMTQNIMPMKEVPIDYWHTYEVMNRCALYRCAPWVYKKDFWYYTGDVNIYMVNNQGTEGTQEVLYMLDDAAIAKHLRTQGLSATDTGEKGAFKLIHLFGPHYPLTMNENAERVSGSQTSHVKQSIGSIKVVELYINELKRLGLYDESTIIVMSDHGVWSDQYDPIRQAVSPLLMVKPRTDHPDDTPCVTSKMPVSQEDFSPTVIQAIGAAYSSFGSGMSVWDVNDPQRLRYYDALTAAGSDGRRIVEYEIQGDALTLANWFKTGTEWFE